MDPTQQDAKAQKYLVQSAYDHLIAAKTLFEGDITNSLIVNGHLAICDVIRGDPPKALKISFDIGDAGRRTGNTCTSEFVGFLHLRLARRLAFDEAREQHALMLCACATACFKGLNDPYLELHAVTAFAQFHQRRGDIPMARKHVEKGRKLLELVARCFDELIAQVRSLRSSHEDQEQPWLVSDLNKLQGERTSCITEVDCLALAIDSSGQNTQNRFLEQKTTSSSLNQSSRLPSASSIQAQLQSFKSQFSGLILSLPANLQPLYLEAMGIDNWHQRYEDVIKGRREELVIKADIDAAEKHLIDFLTELEESSSSSEHSKIMKTAIFLYLGEFDKARSTIISILPTTFGGTKKPLPERKGMDKQVKDVIDDVKRQTFNKAIALCFAAKDWEHGMSGVQDMPQRHPTSLDDKKSCEDPHVWYNMVWIASTLEQSGNIGQAFEWYLNAFYVVEAHRQQLADSSDRREILSTISSGELFLGMARVALRFSRFPDGASGPSQYWTLNPAEWKDQCLRFLELGRSRTLLDLLIAQDLAPQDFRDRSEYSYQLRLEEVVSSTEDTAEIKSQSRADNEPESRERYLECLHDELLTELRSQSLSKLLPESAIIRESNAKLYQCIPEAAIVLHISSSREGLMILCITSQGIIDDHNAEMTSHHLDKHIFRYTKSFRDVRSAEPSDLPALTTCDHHLQAISDEIIKPIARHIETKEHVIFVPSPSLNKLPLCALIFNEKPLFLSKDVSRVPSLSVLQHLADQKHYPNKKVNVIYKDPDPTRGDALGFSTAAAIHVASSFGAKPQAANGEFTQDNFIRMYEQSDILLVATHGTQSPKSAWESSLLLQPPFRVLDLARMHSNASLIIFEACVSGLGEESIGNDLLGFSHAVLASGATAFLGGLWR
ncbi:hypothetical protein LTR35_017724, partial [Friedmanniomyces endolithicus]